MERHRLLQLCKVDIIERSYIELACYYGLQHLYILFAEINAE